VYDSRPDAIESAPPLVANAPALSPPAASPLDSTPTHAPTSAYSSVSRIEEDHD